MRLKKSLMQQMENLNGADPFVFRNHLDEDVEPIVAITNKPPRVSHMAEVKQ